MMSMISSCGHEASEEELAQQQADSFGSYYYNWRFVDAAKFATSQSRHRLSFLTSNVDTTAIAMLRSRKGGANVNVGDVDMLSDTSCTVSISADNFLRLDTVGSAPTLQEHEERLLTMKKRDGKWLVDFR